MSYAFSQMFDRYSQSFHKLLIELEEFCSELLVFKVDYVSIFAYVIKCKKAGKA